LGYVRRLPAFEESSILLSRDAIRPRFLYASLTQAPFAEVVLRFVGLMKTGMRTRASIDGPGLDFKATKKFGGSVSSS
jgi:hypothetical protein